MPKLHKCGYGKCLFNSKDIPEGDEASFGGKFYHKKCLQTKNDIELVKHLYIKKIDQSAPYAYLTRVINDIVFKKGISSQQLIFALQYAIDEHIDIHTPAGLHYLIINKNVRAAWEKHLTAKGSKIKFKPKNTKPIFNDEAAEIKPALSKPKHKSFGSIFGEE